IDYIVNWSGQTFVDASARRIFVGVGFAFAGVLHTPGSAHELRFSFTVRPPSEFSVSYTNEHPEYGAGGPSDTSIYATMAGRAFDELSTRLQGVFFGLPPGTPPR